MDFLIQYAMSFLGVPYKWGGSTPIDGIDCSGLVQEILASAGLKPPGDNTAQGLYNVFSHTGSFNVFAPGALSFYGASSLAIVHVGFIIDPYRMIEAGGGGASVQTKDDAINHEAFVKIRLIKHRPDLICTIKPNYSSIGLI